MAPGKAHTPPWKVGRGPAGEVEILGGMRMNASPILASMEHDDREANAALIVRAVNNHDALIAALETAESAMTVHGGNRDCQFDFEETLFCVRSVLAIAKGGPR